MVLWLVLVTRALLRAPGIVNKYLYCSEHTVGRLESNPDSDGFIITYTAAGKKEQISYQKTIMNSAYKKDMQIPVVYNKANTADAYYPAYIKYLLLLSFIDIFAGFTIKRIGKIAWEDSF